MNNIIKKMTFLLLFIFIATTLWPQANNDAAKKDSLDRVINRPNLDKKNHDAISAGEKNIPGGSEKDPEVATTKLPFMLTSKETILSFSVLTSLFLLIILEVLMIYKLKISEDNAIKLITITLVLMGTLFIIMAGYDERVIAPVFGLFGTIVGYLFGKSAAAGPSPVPTSSAASPLIKTQAP